MIKSENINELATALSKFQGELPTVKKDSVNPFFRSKYADLSAIMEAIKGVLSKNGLSVVQTIDPCEKVRLITTLMHTSGQWIESVIEMTPKDNTPQAFGSCITYARRYALSAMLGVVSDVDDDGNAASIKKNATTGKIDASGDDLPAISVPKDIKIETFTRSDGVVIDKKSGKPI